MAQYKCKLKLIKLKYISLKFKSLETSSCFLEVACHKSSFDYVQYKGKKHPGFVIQWLLRFDPQVKHLISP